MDRIQETIKFFLNKKQIDNPKSVYLVAFSGGYDSMCLLHGLTKVCPKNQIIAIHLNHKWRGTESDNEELHCKNFCAQMGIQFYSEELSDTVPKTETAARDARYNFFEKCAKIFNSKIIFTAHNANDNVETLLYRLCMGTGIVGMSGISEQRNIYYRPLLNIYRTEIEKYCKHHHLQPNNDSSNKNTKYKRNYIRAEIIPALTNVNSNALDKINSFAQTVQEENDIITEYITQVTNKISLTESKIKTQKFLNQTLPVQKRIIYNIFTTLKLDYNKFRINYILDFINQNKNSKAGKTCSLTANLWLFVNSEILEIVEKNNKKNNEYLHITKEGKYESENFIFEITPFTKDVKKFPRETENIAYVNLSKYEIDFEIRPRQNGDIIKPFGLNGSQKLKKYLNSKKIPNHEKDSLLFLAQGNEILWAINIGISDRIKVGIRPTHVLKFYKKEQ